jgi:hypothetical protein
MLCVFCLASGFFFFVLLAILVVSNLSFLRGDGIGPTSDQDGGCRFEEVHEKLLVAQDITVLVRYALAWSALGFSWR